MTEIKSSSSPEVKNVNLPQGLIKDIPTAQDILSNLKAIRTESAYAPDGIWSDARLETATQGVAIFRDVFNQSSDQLKQYLNEPDIIQAFTGVRPIVFLGSQDPKTSVIEGSFNSRSGQDSFPQIEKELRVLLDNYAKEKLQIVLTNFSKLRIPGANKDKLELMNFDAIDNVAHENPDLFPSDQSVNLPNWLIQNLDKWPMTPMGKNKQNDYMGQIMSGIVSGFPRSASNSFAEWTMSGLDFGKMFKNILSGNKGNKSRVDIRKMKDKRLDLSPEIRQTMMEAGLPFVLYEESDLTWIKEAAALAKQFTTILGLNTV